jgi:hypothetical protein
MEVQNFLQPRIKKKPAQHHFQGSEPNKATAYPQVSLPKRQREKGKRARGEKVKRANFPWMQHRLIEE